MDSASGFSRNNTYVLHYIPAYGVSQCCLDYVELQLYMVACYTTPSLQQHLHHERKPGRIGAGRRGRPTPSPTGAISPCRRVRLPMNGCRPGLCPPVGPDHLDHPHGLGQPTRPLDELALMGSQHMDPGRPSLQHIGQNKLFGEVLRLTSAFALVGAPRGSSQNLNVQIAWPNLHTSAPHAPL